MGTIAVYHAHPVGQLSTATLSPSLHVLEQDKPSTRGDPNTALAVYGKVIDSCNACHVAMTSELAEIVDRSNDNPFMQDFKP